jgi:hypothetical protein
MRSQALCLFCCDWIEIAVAQGRLAPAHHLLTGQSDGSDLRRVRLSGVLPSVTEAGEPLVP